VENRTNLARDVYVTAQSERVAALRGVHDRSDGSEIEVTIEVRDNGPNAGEHRYHADVSAECVKTIRGNAGSRRDLDQISRKTSPNKRIAT
jgi:hypothetical protein